MVLRNQQNEIVRYLGSSLLYKYGKSAMTVEAKSERRCHGCQRGYDHSDTTPCVESIYLE